MAYPFAPAIKVGEFIKRVCADHGGSVEKKARRVNGVVHSFRVLERQNHGAKVRVPVDCSDDVPLAPSVLRSLCARLKLDPTKFGFGLDGPAQGTTKVVSIAKSARRKR